MGRGKDCEREVNTAREGKEIERKREKKIEEREREIE